MMPATKPPSRRSRPSSAASATSPNTSTTANLMASWVLVSSVPSSGASRANRAHGHQRDTTAMRDEGQQDQRRASGWVVESHSVISRIGPNSPTAPAASR